MNHSIIALLIHPPLWFALLLALALAGGAWAVRWLTLRGAIATAGIGLIVFGMGGGKAAAPLLAFFLSSSLLSKLGKSHKAGMVGRSDQDSVRSAGQVLANGGVAAALVLAHRIDAYHLSVDATHTLQILFLAALATVNADTWATELGGLWSGLPRHLASWRRVSPGTSGAISLPGTLASLAGAVFIPFCVYRLWPLSLPELVVVAWAGFLGSLFDSILGASLQAQYRDPVTSEVTERSRQNGKPSLLIRGLPWVNNDVVNFLASIGGALFAWVLLHYGMRNVF